MHVYVITNPASGWDCVCGVVNAKGISNEEAAVKYWLQSIGNSPDDEGYIAHYCEVEN